MTVNRVSRGEALYEQDFVGETWNQPCEHIGDVMNFPPRLLLPTWQTFCQARVT